MFKLIAMICCCCCCFLLQLLSEANATISALREQLSGLDRSAAVAKETASSRLQDSTGQIQVNPAGQS